MRIRRRAKFDPLEGLFDPSKVDLVALAPDGWLELIVVADAPWTGSHTQIRSLQEKVHAYVGFALDGQLAAEFPDDADLPWRVAVQCVEGLPDARTASVLTEISPAVRRYGGDLVVRETRPHEAVSDG